MLVSSISAGIVSLPYGFTLFSNKICKKLPRAVVSLPYGFTLFSNYMYADKLTEQVSLPYGFTLFSNMRLAKPLREQSFTTLWIYTILKPWKIRFALPICFTTLWIYTILKPNSLDLIRYLVSLPYGFTLFSNVTSDTAKELQFHYLMDLHYSQTLFLFVRPFFLFHYLMDLHYSQTRFYKKTKNAGFTTLWIYTILKPRAECVWVGSVSLPYGFTLFSNHKSYLILLLTVSLPYGFTLFSNATPLALSLGRVSLPYGFTLFSNYFRCRWLRQ